MRSIKNVGEGDAIYVIVGAKGGYVGRDGRTADGASRGRRGRTVTAERRCASGPSSTEARHDPAGA